MNDFIVETHALTKRFGSRVAVDGVDLRVLLFTAAISLLSAVMFGLLPVLRFARGNLFLRMGDVGLDVLGKVVPLLVEKRRVRPARSEGRDQGAGRTPAGERGALAPCSIRDPFETTPI